MTQPRTIYAEDINYWKTGTSSPDTWMDHTKKEIRAAGGKVINEAYGADHEGRAAYQLTFQIGEDTFRAIWPVLKSKTGNEKAARIQAATMLFHDVKARCVSAKVHGARAAFLSYLVLPDGRTAAQASTPEIAEQYPRVLLLPGPKD